MVVASQDSTASKPVGLMRRAFGWLAATREAIRELPKPRKFRLLLRAGLISVGVCAAFLASCFLEKQLWFYAAMPTVLVLAASLGEFVLADLWTEARYPPETSLMLARLEQDLKGTHERIQVAIDRVIDALEGCDKTLVGGTFHLLVTLYPAMGPVNDRALIQVVDYIGRPGGAPWRETPVTKGVIGRCVRTENQEVVNFASKAEYDARMIADFGFSRDEVAAHTTAARSYCAQPVHVRHRIVGAIYLFSTEPQVFPRALNSSVLEAAAREIAAFLEGARIVGT
jgi:hypothetical protein